MHFLGAVTALGAVLATDAANAFLHVRPEAAPTTAKQAPVFSLLIWIGLLVLSVTGLLMFLELPTIIHSGLFRAKMAIVFVIFVNGVAVNAWLVPRLQELSGEWERRTARVRRFTKVAAVSATVSLAGWFAAIIAGYALVR